MKNKKSQMQMIETISVLFVFFILVIIGFVFFTRVQGWGMKAQIEEAVQKKAVKITQIASFLPELQCSDENIVKDNCVDIEKINVVSGAGGIFETNEDYYFDIFGYATIKVEEKYPIPAVGLTTPAVLYDKPGLDWKNKIEMQVPILLKDSLDKRYNFGLMTVITYSK